MHILPDKKLKSEPISSAIDYTWVCLSGNWKNSAVIAILLLILSLLQAIPFVGIIATVLQSLLLYSVSFWIVDKMTGSTDIEAFKLYIKTARPKEMIFSFSAPASGFYTAFILFSVLMVFVTAFIFWLTGGGAAFGMIQEQMARPELSPEQAISFYTQLLGKSAPAIIFFLISSSFFGYLWPLVYGYALLQKNFFDAMNALFMFFSIRFWKASFSMDYFKTVSLWMLIVFAVMILIVVSAALVFLFPVAILLMLWLAYFSAIVAVGTYNMCDDI